MSQEKLDHVVAGCLYDFMGWLTTRPERLVLSSSDDAAPAADAVQKFLTMRGVDQSCEPMIEFWESRCSMVDDELGHTERGTNGFGSTDDEVQP